MKHKIKKEVQKRLAEALYKHKKIEGQSLDEFTQEFIVQYNELVEKVGYINAYIQLGGTKTLDDKVNRDFDHSLYLTSNPKLREMFDDLKDKGVQMAIVTGNTRKGSTKILEKVLGQGGSKLFNVIITRDDSEAKPALAPFVKALDKLSPSLPGLTPGKCWTVGDIFVTDIRPLVNGERLPRYGLAKFGHGVILSPRKNIPPEYDGCVYHLENLSRLGRFMAALEERSLD